MKISTTSERLQSIMADLNYRQVDILNLCKPYCEKFHVKLARNDLSQYVNGKVEPGQEKLSILSLALNVSEAWLMGYDVPKDRDKPIIVSHQELNSDALLAISTLASYGGYHLNLFANQYEIKTGSNLIKLSPKEVEDYVHASIEKICFVTRNIINNKLHANIVPIQKDYIVPKAAHNDFSDDENEQQLMKEDIDEL